MGQFCAKCWCVTPGAHTLLKLPIRRLWCVGLCSLLVLDTVEPVSKHKLAADWFPKPQLPDRLEDNTSLHFPACGGVSMFAWLHTD